MGIRRSKEFWQGHIDLWRAGQLTQTAYCDAVSISYGSFTRWKATLEGSPKAMKASKLTRNAKIPQQQPVLLPLHVEEDGAGASSPSASGLKLHCGRFTVDVGVGFDPATLRALLTILG